jgi:hypothetical protein
VIHASPDHPAVAHHVATVSVDWPVPLPGQVLLLIAVVLLPVLELLQLQLQMPVLQPLVALPLPLVIAVEWLGGRCCWRLVLLEGL